jgi:cytidyltransferase-like protein
MKSGRIVCCTGYFDPIGFHHLEYFKEAKEAGDILVVIVNNDVQAALKKGKAFMSATDRLKIVRALDIVDFAVMSIDTDRMICDSLRMARPHVLFNAGDVKSLEDLPKAELDVCKEIGAEPVFGKGEKVGSSRWLLKDAKINDY